MCCVYRSIQLYTDTLVKALTCLSCPPQGQTLPSMSITFYTLVLPTTMIPGRPPSKYDAVLVNMENASFEFSDDDLAFSDELSLTGDDEHPSDQDASNVCPPSANALVIMDGSLGNNEQNFERPTANLKHFEIGSCPLDDIAKDLNHLLDISEYDSEAASHMKLLLGEAKFMEIRLVRAESRELTRQIYEMKERIKDQKNVGEMKDREVGLAQMRIRLAAYHITDDATSWLDYSKRLTRRTEILRR
jgi:hypothetical protein